MREHGRWSIVWRLLTLAGLAAVVLLAACRPPTAGSLPTFVPPPTIDVVPGSTTTVVRGDLVETVETRGRVVARQEALLVFPLEGSLREVYVSPGDQVAAGDLLAELDAPEVQRETLEREFDLAIAELELERTEVDAAYSVAQAQAEVAVAQAQYDQTVLNGQITVERAERSAAGGCDAWCQASLAQTRSQAALANQVALARLQSAQAALSLASATSGLEVQIAEQRAERAEAFHLLAAEALSSTLLAAPFDGIVISVESRPGDRVEAYEAIGAIADPSELWVVATVLEEEIDRIAVGQAVAVRLDAYPDALYSGTVLQIASEAIIWQGKSAYEVTIAFDDGQAVPATIRMGADVTIAGRAREEVLVVPTQAILTIGEREYVEVVGEGGEVQRVEVETGVSSGAETEIVAGLQEGQVVRIP